jgi:glucosamine--fructose-6-phosphate aminotransferase (isomerizing)
MCGIVGMISGVSVVTGTVDRLALMEYRGYDSYGLATVPAGADTVTVTKDIGSIGQAVQAGRFADVAPAQLALAHTRWATHGGVTQANAHPHLSYDGRVALVHNGVIENHVALRRRLEAEGITFTSETDTEVVVHLLAWHLEHGATGVLEALSRTTGELTGEYALGVIAVAEPDVVYGAKQKSPLVVVHTGDTGVLASDQMALAGLGGQALFLEDGDLVRVTPAGAEVFTTGPDGQVLPTTRPYTTLDENHQRADKGPYPHWMIKEIHETPDAARTALGVAPERFAGVIPAGDRPVTLIGAGSAYYVAQMGQYFFAELAGISAIALPSDEAEHLALLRPGDALIAVSQSGETFDTLEICRAAVAAGAVLTSISNVPNSTQERLATHRLQQGSGPEICVLSTKSIVSQVLLLARLALETGRSAGTLSETAYRESGDSLDRLPDTLSGLLTDLGPAIQDLAKKYSLVEDWFFIGRGVLWPVACEDALKYKEVSYRHAEGMPAGFFKHGTISLIDENFHTVALLPSAHTAHERYAATLAAVSEIAARSGPVIGLGPADADPDDLRNFTDYLPLPYHGDNASDVIIQLVAGQLLAYYCALELGREIDQPRSLAKSVTVR